MDVETPDWARGKPGVFAITHDSNLIYIGKAQYGPAVFKEAKNRENKWTDCFKRNGVLPNNIEDTLAYEYVRNHCRIYVAIIDDEKLRDLIGEVEEYLIFKMQRILLCNSSIKKPKSVFAIVNSGDLPPSLPRHLH